MLEKLPEDVVTSIINIIQTTHLHPDDAYNRIKNRLVTDFAPSKWERIERILDHPDLGDRRPSAMMAAMLSHSPASSTPYSCVDCHGNHSCA